MHSTGWNQSKCYSLVGLFHILNDSYFPNVLPISPQQFGTSGGSTGSGAGVSGTWRNSILQNYKTKHLSRTAVYWHFKRHRVKRKKVNLKVKKEKTITLTTPSECPVTITFCVSQSFISEMQQQRICWLRPVKVLALAMGLPLMLHTWM